jgi:hypothetical protein
MKKEFIHARHNISFIFAALADDFKNFFVLQDPVRPSDERWINISAPQKVQLAFHIFLTQQKGLLCLRISSPPPFCYGCSFSEWRRNSEMPSRQKNFY